LQQCGAVEPASAAVPALDIGRVEKLLALAIAFHGQGQQAEAAARHLESADQAGTELHGALDALPPCRGSVKVPRARDDAKHVVDSVLMAAQFLSQRPNEIGRRFLDFAHEKAIQLAAQEFGAARMIGSEPNDAGRL